MILGLWAPSNHWFLQNIYPIFIYFVILYPWTTFITQQSYWSIPVFLFINLHLSGIFAYRSARQYWKNNHLVNFITSTFIPYYDDFTQFEQRYNHKSNKQHSDDDDMESPTSPNQTLQSGFQRRHKKMNNYDFNLHESLKLLRKETTDPFKQKEENITSWADIAGSENKLSLTLFYEAVGRMWRRFWTLTALTALPIIITLLIEIVSPNLHSSITINTVIKSEIFSDIFIPINVVINFVRIFYVISEFIFMAVYFQFITECHRGDVFLHLHYYDTSDIALSDADTDDGDGVREYYDQMEGRLASIVWDWDRIASSIRQSSKSLRYWLFVMVCFNFIAGVTAVVNLSIFGSLNAFPQHLEMYLPAIVNLGISFFVLLIGTKLSHMNTAVNRRANSLLTSIHFDHIDLDIDKSMELEMRKQTLYIQAQTVAQAVTNREIGISVYGLVLNRTLFLAFFSPFVAFSLFCINTWLP